MNTPIRAAWAATILSLAGLLGLCPPAAHAQCGPRWISGPGQGIRGTNAGVSAFAALPGGDLIAVGAFTAADSAITNLVTRWNGSTWTSVGGGLPGATYANSLNAFAAAVSPTGDVYIGGSFQEAATGIAGTNYIARWSGVAWSGLGTGLDNTAQAVIALPNGNIVAAGRFSNAGGSPASRIAQWNGVAWSPLGAGLGGGIAYSMALLPNGNLLVGGTFQTAGGNPAQCLAVYDGASWSPFPAPLTTSPSAEVRALLALPDGTIYAGGSFVTPSGAVNIAKWTGVSWLPLGAGVNGAVNAITRLTNGDIAVGGSFTLAGGGAASGLAAWNGLVWSRVGTTALPTVLALAPLPNNELAIGVSQPLPQPISFHGITYGASGVWRTNAGGLDEFGADAGLQGSDTPNTDVFVNSIIRLTGGDIVALGTFTRAGRQNVNNGLARWNGRQWASIGSAFTAASVYTIAALPNNEFIAAGFFSSIGGVNASRIARWTGSGWAPFGAGLFSGGSVYALLVLPNGDILAGGADLSDGVSRTSLARWNGSAWSFLPSSVNGSTLNRISSLLAMPNGDIIAGGGFTSINGVSASNIARWNGAAWTPLGNGLTGTSIPNVTALRLRSNGNILAGGSFISSGAAPAFYVAEWDGSAWNSYGVGATALNDSVNALEFLPSGALVAGGRFFSNATGASGTGFAQWTGSAWQILGGGVTRPEVAKRRVDALLTLPNHEILVGGSFTKTGDLVSTYWARWTETGIPTIAQQPQPQTRRVRGAVTYANPASAGYDFSGALTFQWRRDGIALSDGATSSGSIITGASTPTLTIANLAIADSGQITCDIANSCGGVTTIPALLSVLPPCPGDANADGVVDFLDLNLVLGAFGSAVAPFASGDVNGDGQVDFTDLNLVLANFAAAC